MPILELPLISQWGVGANRFNRDCGAACIAMFLEYYGLRGNLTVDQLAAEAGLPPTGGGLSCADLVKLGARHGLMLKAISGATRPLLEAEIDKGRVVIPLVAYRYILGRLDQGDNQPGTDGHFFVVVGYGDDHIVANDPDYWIPFTERGHDVLIPVTEIEKAMAPYGGQCVILDGDAMDTLEQINALAKQAQTAINQAQGLLNQIVELSAKVETPPPPPTKVERVVTGAQGANVRSLATISSTIIRTLIKGTAITVIENQATADGHVWAKITAAGFSDVINGFVAQDLLGPKS